MLRIFDFAIYVCGSMNVHVRRYLGQIHIQPCLLLLPPINEKADVFEGETCPGEISHPGMIPAQLRTLKVN